jgi:hypothetical protein
MNEDSINQKGSISRAETALLMQAHPGSRGLLGPYLQNSGMARMSSLQRDLH